MITIKSTYEKALALGFLSATSTMIVKVDVLHRESENRESRMSTLSLYLIKVDSIIKEMTNSTVIYPSQLHSILQIAEVFQTFSYVNFEYYSRSM